MKILKLGFSNINSLKGAFNIDFEAPELANAGLFAITGPTGAGKSSILDAITLALYGYTARFQEVTKTTIEDDKGIITKGTTESYASITFQVNGETYRSQWSAGLTRSGKLTKILLKVSKQEDGEFKPISDKLKDSRAEIIKIIGLSQEQFTQAIVLSQGKFDEFLKAKNTDRYALLEIITGTVVFREIGKLAYDRHRDIKDRIRQLTENMDMIAVMSETEREEFEVKKQTLVKEQIEGAQTITALGSKIKTKQNIAALMATVETLDKEKLLLAKEEEDLKEAMDRLQEFEKTAPLMNRWNALQSKQKELQAEHKKLEEAKSTLHQLLDESTGLIDALSIACGKSIDAHVFEEALDAFFNLVDGMDLNINRLEAATNAQRTPLANTIKNLPEKTKAVVGPISADIDKLNQYLQEQQNALEKNPLPAAFTHQHYEDAKSHEQNRIAALGSCISLLELVVKNETDKKTFEEEINNSEKKTSELKQSVLRMDAGIAAENVALEALLKAVEANNAILSMDIHRQNLVDGNPCPCCGSTHHPYSIHLPKLNNALQENYTARKAANEKEIDLKNKAIRDIELLERDGLNQKKMIESINIDLETRKQELKGKLKSWGIPESADVQMIKSSIADAEENIRVINLHQEWMMVKAILDQFIKDMEVFLQNQANLQNMKQERAALFSGGSIHVFKDKLKQDWTRITTSVLKEQNAIEKATSGIETIQQFILKENALFDAAITENGFADRAAFSLAMADLDTIDSTRKQVIDFKKRKDQHTGKSSQANAELLFLRSQDDAQLMLEELLSTEKEQKELLDKNLYEQGQIDQSLKTDAAKKQQHEGILLQLAMLEKEEKIHGILNSYIGDAQGNKFNNIVQRITMRHLFGLANIRLETLMDRYQLELGSEADEDSIWVVDMHMGDEWRTIDSVSGGERFVISLALALALSDMASQNVRIDSMFIDEGFGTLSPDDLYNAIAMLERMQVEGDKLVGIISHVESLKERIGTQILVEKLQNGESMLYLKCNEEKRGLKIKQP